MHALSLPRSPRQLLVAALLVVALAVAGLAAAATGANAATKGGIQQAQTFRAGGDRAITGQTQADDSGPTIVLVLHNGVFVPTEQDGPWIWWDNEWHPYANGWMLDVTGSYYEFQYYEIASVNVLRTHWGYWVQLGSEWVTANRHGRFNFLGQWYQLVRIYPHVWGFFLVQPPGAYGQPQG